MALKARTIKKEAKKARRSAGKTLYAQAQHSRSVSACVSIIAMGRAMANDDDQGAWLHTLILLWAVVAHVSINIQNLKKKVASRFCDVEIYRYAYMSEHGEVLGDYHLPLPQLHLFRGVDRFAIWKPPERSAEYRTRWVMRQGR